MKKIIAVLALCFSISAHASVISIETSESSVTVGQSVTVSLNATDFEPVDFFDFNFNFDTSLFSYDVPSLMTDLDPLSIFEVNQTVDGMAFSFADTFVIDGDFLLASFQLVAIASGSSSLSISDALFGDFIMGDVTVDTSSVTQVAATAVSTPATLALFTLGGLLVLRRKL